MFFVLQAVSTLVYQLGLKSAMKVLCRWPGLLLISLFSTFMLSCENSRNGKHLIISKKLTLVNYALTILFTFAGRAVYDFVYFPNKFEATLGWDYVIENYGLPSYFLTLTVCLPLYVLAGTCVLILLLGKLPCLKIEFVEIMPNPGLISFGLNIENFEAENNTSEHVVEREMNEFLSDQNQLEPEDTTI